MAILSKTPFMDLISRGGFERAKEEVTHYPVDALKPVHTISSSRLRKKLDPRALERELESHKVADDEMDALIYSTLATKEAVDRTAGMRTAGYGSTGSTTAGAGKTMLISTPTGAGTSLWGTATKATEKTWFSPGDFTHEYGLEDTTKKPLAPSYGEGESAVYWKEERVVPFDSVSAESLSKRHQHAMKASLIMVRKQAPHMQGVRLQRRSAILDQHSADLMSNLEEVLHLSNFRREKYGHLAHRNYSDDLNRLTRKWDEALHSELSDHIGQKLVEEGIAKASLQSDAPDVVPEALFAELDAAAESAEMAQRAVW